MKPPLNRRIFVVGYAAATPLGKNLESTWKRAIKAEAGFGPVTRCEVDSLSNIVGEIPDWDPSDLDFISEKDVHNWNAQFVHLSMHVIHDALLDAGLEMTDGTAERTACLMGSALNGSDSMRIAIENLHNNGPNRVSPFLLPSLCANLPAGKAGMLEGFNGPIFSPQAACASGNFAIGVGARMIRDGDIDFALAGGVETAILPEIIHGFANMNATIKIREKDRAKADLSFASRPYSIDRKGFVLSEGAATLVLASEDGVKAHGLSPKAEVLGVGWASDAYHITKPNPKTVERAIRGAIDDAELSCGDIQYINAHGTSTPQGDPVEIECLKEVFGSSLEKVPLSSNKSQIGHTLGAAAAIEAVLTIEGMQNGTILPTINYIPDPKINGADFVPDEARKQSYSIALSNAFGFGGTNCCIVLRGV